MWWKVWKIGRSLGYLNTPHGTHPPVPLLLPPCYGDRDPPERSMRPPSQFPSPPGTGSSSQDPRNPTHSAPSLHPRAPAEAPSFVISTTMQAQQLLSCFFLFFSSSTQHHPGMESFATGMMVDGRSLARWPPTARSGASDARCARGGQKPPASDSRADDDARHSRSYVKVTVVWDPN